MKDNLKVSASLIVPEFMFKQAWDKYSYDNDSENIEETWLLKDNAPKWLKTAFAKWQKEVKTEREESEAEHKGGIIN
jgi:hypothetical protein